MLKSPLKAGRLFPDRGFTMASWAAAGFTRMGICRAWASMR